MFLKGTSFHFMNDKFRFDGDFFVRNLDASVERSTRRGKGPRNTLYSILHMGTCTHGENSFVLSFYFTQVPYFVKSEHAARRSKYFALFLSQKRNWSRRCRICIPRSGFEIHQKHCSRRREGRDQRGLFVINILTSVFLEPNTPLLKIMLISQ